MFWVAVDEEAALNVDEVFFFFFFFLRERGECRGRGVSRVFFFLRPRLSLHLSLSFSSMLPPPLTLESSLLLGMSPENMRASMESGSCWGKSLKAEKGER